MDPLSRKESIRFLSFSNDKEDAEKAAKLREAAEKIEQAVARDKSLSELVDYKESVAVESIDLANDTRPLYERLQEQRNKKKDALEESQKLSNLVTKLDDEDVDYLNEVLKNKQEDEVKKRLEVFDALEAKRRLDEERQLEEEKQLKKSLSNSMPTNKTSSIKSRLSSLIKVKPRLKQTVPEQNQSTDEPADGIGSSRKEANKSHEQNPHDGCKRSRPSDTESHDSYDDDSKRKKVDRDDNSDDDEIEPHTTINDDRKRPAQVMQSLGILPSLPIVFRTPGSSDDSDSSSDLDDINRKFLLKMQRRHQHQG